MAMGHHGAMAIRRILAGHARLHKLPYYMAIPAGMIVGWGIGYAASMPTAGPRTIALMIGAFLAVMVLGVTAPQPIRRTDDDDAPLPLSPDSLPGATSLPGGSPYDGPNDSLCD